MKAFKRLVLNDIRRLFLVELSERLLNAAFFRLRDHEARVICGKFVFWRNPDRLKGYVCDYLKAQK